MASAIIGGLVTKGVSKQNITVSEPWDVNREKLAAVGVKTTTDNTEAGANADIVIIAVKPQVTKGVCEELGASWSKRTSLPVVVSIAAGITLSSLEEWSRTPDGRSAHVVRVMPNTPALVGEGASGAYASADVTSEEKELVNALLSSVSKATEWVDKEELLDVVTGLSGKSIDRRKLVYDNSNISIRIWTCLLFRYGGTPHCQCYRSGLAPRTGYSLGYPDLSRCWQDAC